MNSASAGRRAQGATAATSLALLLAGVVLALLAMRALWWKPAELPVLAQVPAFSLLDQEGARIDLARLRGRLWVASFLYTSCPGPCPILVEHIAALRKRVAPEDLAVVSFSVDPDTDSVAVLATYAKAHGILASRAWWLATGPEPEMWALIQKGFLTAVGREEAGAASPNGPIFHSTRLLLVDGEGRIRGVYASEEEEALARLEKDAKNLSSLLSRQTS